MAPSSRSDSPSQQWRATIRADTLEELFVEAALVVSRQCGQTAGEAGPWHTVRVSSNNREALLVEWLNELLGRSGLEQRAFEDVRALRLYNGRVTADVRGRPVVEWTSRLRTARLPDVVLERDGARWKAEVTFDI